MNILELLKTLESKLSTLENKDITIEQAEDLGDWILEEGLPLIRGTLNNFQ